MHPAAAPDVRLDPRLRFDSFVVSAGNRLAAAAARAVAESPGHAYNPLFIYGPAGLGKTHLLHAVGHLMETLHPGAAVEYASLEEFVEQLHAAVSSGQMDGLTRRYDRVDLLLIDDAQLLSGRAETQAELLRLFGRMMARDKQVVLASSRAPQDLADVDAGLVGFLSGGLVVDVAPPDDAARAASPVLASLPSPSLARATDSEFEDFLSEITVVVQQQVQAMEAGGRDPARPAQPARLATPVAARPRDLSWLDREKVVWTWPDVTSRMIEDLR